MKLKKQQQKYDIIFFFLCSAQCKVNSETHSFQHRHNAYGIYLIIWYFKIDLKIENEMFFLKKQTLNIDWFVGNAAVSFVLFLHIFYIHILFEPRRDDNKYNKHKIQWKKKLGKV